MFRTKQNVNNNEQIIKKKSSVLTNNDSSTDEGSNQKSNVYQLRQKTSPNIVILNNKILSTHIPSITSSRKKNFEFKNDVNDILIKEIIGKDEMIPQNINDKFRSLFDLTDNNKLDIDIKNDINNKYIIPNNSSSLMSKNTLKKNYFNRKDKSLDEYFRNNIIKKYKRKNSININKYNTCDSKCNCTTPKSDKKKRTRILTINKNEIKYNDSEFNKNQINNKNKNDKNHSISKMIFKNNSNLSKQELKELKEKKIEKIIQIMNNNKNPSLNVNFLRQDKKECISILSNISNRNKKILTLQNNLNFNDLINSSYKKYKKKLLGLNAYKKEKTDFCDNNDFDNYIEEIEEKDKNTNNLNPLKINCLINVNKIRSSTKDNFYRKSQTNINDLNISTDYTSSEKKNNPKSDCKKKLKHISLDSSSNLILNNKLKTRNIYQNKNMFYKKEKIDRKNYKYLLNNVQKRMSCLINNLINYIELLNNEK